MAIKKGQGQFFQSFKIIGDIEISDFKVEGINATPNIFVFTHCL